VPRGYLVDALVPAWRAAADRLGAVAVICNQRHLSPYGLKSVKGAGYPLLVYTVNHPSRARELFGWGVDGVISDAPDAILGIA
jgi:glycerophosphoryl diester phosphodiesterase